MINLDILNDYKPNSNHRPLVLTLNFFMHSDPIEENYHVQKHLTFNRNKDDLFLNYLKNDLFPLSSMDNIKDLYHNFTTVLSSSITKFSNEVSGKKRNIRTNPWYDKECKNAIRAIKEAMDESLKIDKINRYKALIERKNVLYK